MKYEQDARFADVFLCDGETDFHDYYYINPVSYQEDPIYYHINRSGIESRSPELFYVERDSSFPCNEIFCVLSGNGGLVFREKQYSLHARQLVILPAKEAHSYYSDKSAPLATCWMEFYGSNSEQLIRHIVDQQGPVIEGPIFSEVTSLVTEIQQKLILNKLEEESLAIYQTIFRLLANEHRFLQAHVSEDVRSNFMQAEAYINAHLTENIPNQTLARLSGFSLPYFRQKFQMIYHTTPQRYITHQRILRARTLLIQTEQSIDQISDLLGFCNASHFIRNFRASEGLTPSKYRAKYKIH